MIHPKKSKKSLQWITPVILKYIQRIGRCLRHITEPMINRGFTFSDLKNLLSRGTLENHLSTYAGEGRSFIEKENKFRSTCLDRFERMTVCERGVSATIAICVT